MWLLAHPLANYCLIVDRSTSLPIYCIHYYGILSQGHCLAWIRSGTLLIIYTNWSSRYRERFPIRMRIEGGEAGKLPRHGIYTLSPLPFLRPPHGPTFPLIFPIPHHWHLAQFDSNNIVRVSKQVWNQFYVGPNTNYKRKPSSFLMQYRTPL
jgi:hypothetical protein